MSPLSTTIAKKVYTGNGSTTEFPFAYRFFATTDLVVNLYTIADGTLTLQVEDTDYTVVGGDDGDGGTTDYSSGGTVVMTAAPAATYKLIIERVLPLTQTFDFSPNSDFSEDSFEEELDRIVAILQQQQAIIDRCIKMDKSNTEISDAFDVDDIDVSVDEFIIDELTAKTTIGATDYVAIADGAASNVNKKILASSIININGLTEDTSLHANDVFLFEDSQASYVKKKVKRNNLVNISNLTEKSTIAAADLYMIEDSAASNVKKKVQATNVQPINPLTEKTTPADDDIFVIEDSAASYVKKKVKISNLVYNAAAGTNLQAEAGTDATNTSISYKKIKEIIVPTAGTLTIKFGIKVDASTGYGRIYRNGVAVGTEQSTAETGSYVEKSENIAGWSKGDLCQLYVHINGVNHVYTNYLRIYESEATDYYITLDSDDD